MGQERTRAPQQKAPLFDHLTLDRGAMHLKDELMSK